MRYHNITYHDMKNGDGLRVVLWLAGCSHHCHGCQNPVTWDPNDGVTFDWKAKNEIYNYLAEEYCSGLTLSGGDPLFQGNRAEVYELLVDVKNDFPCKDIWLYTGYLWEEVLDLDVMRYVDVLVDGKFVEKLKDNTLHWKGSSNQRVIDVKRSLEDGCVRLWHTA